MDNIEPGNSAPVESVDNSAPVEGFLGSLNEDLRAEASLQDFSDVNGLAKSYVAGQRMLGSSIRIPGEDSGEDTRNEFYNKVQTIDGIVRLPSDSNDKDGWGNIYNKLGRPADATGYQLDLPEGMNVNEGMLSMAHELGLNNAQVNKYIEFESAQTAQINEANVLNRASSESALKQSWGADYNNRMDGAKAAIRTYSDKYPDAVNELINGPAGNNPALLNMLSDLYGGLQEKGIINDTTASSVQYGMSTEEALDQIKEIRSNREHPAFDVSHPGHKSAAAKVQQLYGIAYGE
jgi:hypothetical protein